MRGDNLRIHRSELKNKSDFLWLEHWKPGVTPAAQQ